MVRVVLPFHLRNLAGTGKEVMVDVGGPVNVSSVISALEEKYPVLKGTIREHESLKRRAYLRFFAAGEDISFESPEKSLPESIAQGRDPFMVVGAIAGG